jgi:hypothetical protein
MKNISHLIQTCLILLLIFITTQQEFRLLEQTVAVQKLCANFDSKSSLFVGSSSELSMNKQTMSAAFPISGYFNYYLGGR